jgi:hypothetical protein
MSSIDASLVASEPFIQKFVYAIIQNIKAKNFAYEDKHVIHSDLVPRVSKKVMQASLIERVTPRIKIAPAPVVPPVIPRRIAGAPVLPMSKPRPPVPVQRMAPAQQIAPPGVPQGAPRGLSQDYGKITPLLNDPSVSTIECQGAGKPLMIIRAGQKQGTKIVLNADDIKEVLQKVSDAVHIPLLEGVFRAAVDNFSINAVISDMIGSRFVIKKQTAYAMLER